MTTGNVNPVAFNALDASTYDTFQTIFGVPLFPVTAGALNSLGLINGTLHPNESLIIWCLGAALVDLHKADFYYWHIVAATNLLFSGASNIQGRSLDIFCNSDWEEETDPDGNDYYDENGVRSR